MASFYTMVYIILLLHFCQGVGGAKFTFVNNCSEIIWPAIVGEPKLQSTGFELPVGSSTAVQAPAGWRGRFWGRTGCTFNNSGYGSCATGTCDSGQLECETKAFVSTLVEMTLWSGSTDYYDVSVIDGFNLPVLVEPHGGSGQCATTGCPEDLNRICPSELRTRGGAVCQGACTVFGTHEYCCTSRAVTCGPTNSSQLFKKACPKAYSYPYEDNATSLACSHAPPLTILSPSVPDPHQI